MPDHLLTLKDAAKRLNISLATVTSLVARGDLPVIRISTRCVRVAGEDLAAYVERCREGAK